MSPLYANFLPCVIACQCFSSNLIAKWSNGFKKLFYCLRGKRFLCIFYCKTLNSLFFVYIYHSGVNRRWYALADNKAYWFLVSQLFVKNSYIHHDVKKLRYYVSNKTKGRISKRMFQENKARQIFRKTNISYPLIRTRTCVYQGVRNVRFRKIWRALFSWSTRFEIRPFALLPTFTWLNSKHCSISFDSLWKFQQVCFKMCLTRFCALSAKFWSY